jgi:hypothetical protein
VIFQSYVTVYQRISEISLLKPKKEHVEACQWVCALDLDYNILQPLGTSERNGSGGFRHENLVFTMV